MASPPMQGFVKGFPCNPWLNLLVGDNLHYFFTFSPPTNELKSRIIAYLDENHRDPVIHHWTYKIAEAAA